MIPAPVVQVWDAAGSTALGVLSAVSDFAISDVFCDVGSLAFGLPRAVPGAALLDVDEDRQVRVIQSGAPDMWFLLDEDSRQDIADDPASEVAQFTCRGLAGVLDEAVVVPFGGIGSSPAEWAFTAATPGEIVTDLVGSAQARGLLQGITVAGNATLDATGSPWPPALPDVAYKAGQSLLEVVKGLSGQGVLEWRMNGRVLELHRPAGALDRSLDFSFRPRRDVQSAPYQRNRRAVATAVVVEGADGETVRRTQTLTGRRAREVYVSESQAPDTSLSTIGDLYLAAHAEADVQTSHDLIDGDGTPIPWVDYRPGDRVLTLAGGTTVAARRVKQIVRRLGDNGSTVSLELGSLLDTAEERFDRQIRSLLPGKSSLTS